MPDDADDGGHEPRRPSRDRSRDEPGPRAERARGRGSGRGSGGTGRRGDRERPDGRDARAPAGEDRPERRLAARAPSGRAEPAGLERARQSGNAPPPRIVSSRPTAPRRPALPDEEPHLPRSVRREIERVLGAGDRARDVALALSVGSDAIDLARIDVALEVLAWAKHVAPRVPAVREAYGVARYLDEDFSGALTELQAYRRMTGRVDQNHLIADCLRGLERDQERVVALVEELLADERAPADRRAEAVIVWAAALVDEGQVSAARSLLRRHLAPASTDRDGVLGEPHQLRVLVLAAELAERDGDEDEARAYRALIVRSDPELLEEPAGPEDVGTEPAGPERAATGDAGTGDSGPDPAGGAS